MMKTVGLGVGAAVVGLGLVTKLGLVQSKAKTLATLDTVRKEGKRSERFPFLEAGAAFALEQDSALDEIVDRCAQFFQYDPDVGQAFAEAAAGAAEFLLQVDEIKHRRSVPAQFRAFTSVMRVRLRELRRAIREQAPARLEEFDELVTEVETYTKDSHHNMWCDAHKE
jgi:hypothetical protein